MWANFAVGSDLCGDKTGSANVTCVRIDDMKGQSGWPNVLCNAMNLGGNIENEIYYIYIYLYVFIYNYYVSLSLYIFLYSYFYV